MKRYGSVLIGLAVFLSCIGCHQRPVPAERAGKKVADQLLALYTPMRRLSYQDACGGDGGLTICVDRISVTDAATLVEARIKNGTGFSYSLGGTGSGKAVLAGSDGGKVGWEGGTPERHLDPGESLLHFKMDGRLAGEPVLLTIQGIEKPPMLEPPYSTGKMISISVRLGG